ncbi:MAG: beta-propeller repeat-containing protein [Verrucomicrobia bacterium]|nr:beta-propeller repeat-containing protein [Verrucomicrobiota bacterium]
MKSLLTKLLAVGALAGAAASAHASDYKVLSHYKIGGDNSRYDYISIDAATRRAYVAHEKKFEVINADTGEKLGEIGPVTKAHGVALVPDTGHGFASSGIDDTIIMFDLKTLEQLKRFKSTGSNPDSIMYDPDTKRDYAANHGDTGDVTVIDPATGDIVATVKLDAKTLEGICFDGRGHAFVNDEEKSSVHVFDTHTLKKMATWPMTGGEGGTGIACDPESHRIFSSCANFKMIVLDSDSGKVVAAVATGEDPDGLTFDAKTKRIFTSNFDGTMTIIQQDSPDKYTVLQNVATGLGYKTIGLDAKNGHVMTCGAKLGPKPARVKGGPAPKAPIIPGTFEVLVIGEK